MDLVAFLKARLDEDEAHYREAAGDERNQQWALRESADLNEGYIVAEALRALREVEAKRAILDEHSPGYPVTYPQPSGQPTCGVCHAGGWDWEPENWPCATVRALAAVYRDHPDYDPAWSAT